MDIDWRYAFGEDFTERLKKQLKGRCTNELMILSSSSSTQEDQEAYGTLSYYIEADAKFTATGVLADVGLNEEKMPSKFREKFNAIIDLVKMNFNKIVPAFAEMFIEAETQLSSFAERLSEVVEPFIVNKLSSALGGVS